jgi:hypothetical protein
MSYWHASYALKIDTHKKEKNIFFCIEMHQIKDNMTGALHTKYQSEAIPIQNLNVEKPTIKLVKNLIN